MLQDRLNRIRAGFLEKVDEEAKATVSRATQALRASGIMARIPGAGAAIPAFELPDTSGRVLRSADLLAKGPLILSFYRGKW